MIETKTVYFEKPGKENTKETLELSILAAKQLQSKTLLLSSTTGYSAEMALDMIDEDMKLVVIGHSYGFKEPGKNEMDPQTIKRLQATKNAEIFFATHGFSGIEKSFSSKYGGIYPHRMIADTLRIFSQGTKVIFEDMIMAADAGLVPIHEEIVSVGGTGRGLDTAMIIKTVHAGELFDSAVKRIICLPLKN
ncbi:MAG: hypothetical protein ACOCUT_01995 [bacterium]